MNAHNAIIESDLQLNDAEVSCSIILSGAEILGDLEAFRVAVSRSIQLNYGAQVFGIELQEARISGALDLESVYVSDQLSARRMLDVFDDLLARAFRCLSHRPLVGGYDEQQTLS